MNITDLKTLLASRRMINGQGKYQLKVSNVHLHDGRHIVNFNAFTPSHVSGWETTDADTGEVTKVASLKELISEGTPESLQAAANRNISSGQRDGKDFVPVAGEIVNIVMEKSTTKAGVTGLFISSITPLPTLETKQFSVGDLFGDDENEEPEVEETVEELKVRLAEEKEAKAAVKKAAAK